MDPVFAYFTTGECPVGKLHREEKSHGPRSALDETVIVKVVGQGKKRRNDVPGRFRIRRAPARLERISAADTSISRHVLRLHNHSMAAIEWS